MRNYGVIGAGVLMKREEFPVSERGGLMCGKKFEEIGYIETPSTSGK